MSDTTESFDTRLDKQLANIVFPLVGPRCKTHDKTDFPDLEDGERCLVCAVYDEVDDAKQAIKELVLRDVVGEDDKYPEHWIVAGDPNGLGSKNQLRAEQRAIINGDKA